MYVSDPFNEAERYKTNLMSESEMQIRKMYEHSYRIISNRINRLSEATDENSVAKRMYFTELQQQIGQQLGIIDGQLNVLINDNVKNTMFEMLSVNNNYLNSMGFNYTRTNPSLVVNMANRVVSGSLYGGNWTLSSAIWGNNISTQREIQTIISRGILQGKTTYQIAKELERFVNPNYSRVVASGTRGQIDYNAQRLAKTMIQHAYQEAFVEATINNPFIVGYKWETSGMSNVCAICLERETTDEHGMGEGIFPKDSLPLDHPNGNCTFSIVTVWDDDEIKEAIENWQNGVGDPSLNKSLDYFAEDLFG